MTTATVARVRWLAGKEGLAHAHRGSKPARTVCGWPAVDERFAWPAKARCDLCQAAVVAEASEGEQREIWGK